MEYTCPNCDGPCMPTCVFRSEDPVAAAGDNGDSDDAATPRRTLPTAIEINACAERLIADSARLTIEHRDLARLGIRRAVAHVADDAGNVIGFELSTPGLRGQSGGPVFDSEGKVWGTQSQTIHLDLDFDVDQQVMRGGLPRRVQDSAFLHVGHCVHVDVLKSFMRAHNVRFNEE